MPLLSSVRSYAAFGLAIPRFVKTRLSLEEARAGVRERLENREKRFLDVAERCIFGHSASPYLPLLRAASCELGDLRTLVQREGLETALIQLRNNGVYFSFEEFKGRREVERGDLRSDARPGDFSNPVATRHLSSQTGGSTGRSTTVWASLDDRQERLVNNLITLEAHGLVGVPSARWSAARPNEALHALAGVQFGQVPERRFASRGNRGPKDTLRYGLARSLMKLAARVGGARLPKLEWIDPDDGLPLARWAEATLKTDGRCVIRANVSRAVRVGLAASDHGIDLTGTTVLGSAEPPTPAKVKAITRTGAKFVPSYVFAEGGRVAFGCADPIDGTDMHFMADRLGMIQHPRQVPGTDQMVDAFLFTTLSTKAPMVLLNVEIDDFGIVERRSCGCPLEELGYDRHIRQVFSFGKLTGEGVTLVGSDLLRVLEEVLPQRFGGSPLDYQLIEDEDERSITRLSLVIHPKISIEDENAVIQTVLEELRTKDGAASMAGAIWARAGTFRIERAVPSTTWRGKLMPLHLSRASKVSR